MKVKSAKKTLAKVLLVGLVVAGVGWGLASRLATIRPRSESMPSVKAYVVEGAERDYVSICLTGTLVKRKAKGVVYVEALAFHKKGFEGDGYFESKFFYLSSEADRDDAVLLKEAPFVAFIWKDGQDDSNPTVYFDFDRDGKVDLKASWEETIKKALPPFKVPLRQWCQIADEVK